MRDGRGALIALDRPSRARFDKHLSALVPDGAPIVVTLDDDEQRMHGPPLSVSPAQMHSRYCGRYGVLTRWSHRARLPTQSTRA